MIQKNVTLRDIAERVSLSRMAVSLALRGLPGVPQQTQERVWAVARELGYTPDPVVKKAMRELRSSYHRRNPIVVALITHGADDQWYQYDTLRRYAAGIKARAQEMGLSMEVFQRQENGMRDGRLSDILIARGIEHLIVAPLPPHRVGEGIDLNWNRFCSVAIARSLGSPDLHRVSADHFSSGRTAYARIAEKGYRRIGLVVGKENDMRAGGRWRGGFLVAEAEHGFQCMPPLLEETLTKEVFLQWVDRFEPDAIIMQSLPIISWLREAGIRVPEDIAIARASIVPDRPDMPDAGIAEAFEAVGAAAVNIIAGEFIGNGVGLPKHPTNIEIMGEWVDGASMPVKRRSRAGASQAKEVLPGSLESDGKSEVLSACAAN